VKLVSSVLLGLLLILDSPSAFAADEWPQFRGPGGQGHFDVEGLPLRWSETENVVWKTAIPGSGHSSPVVSGNEIWLKSSVIIRLSPEKEKELLSKLKYPIGLGIAGAVSLRAIAIDRTSGKLIADIELFSSSAPEPIHSLNSYASPSPVIEQGRVYFHFGTYGTACLDTKSRKVVWKFDNINVDHQNGPGSSPVIWNDLLIIHFDGIDRQFVTAFDKQTGKTVWTKTRTGKMNDRREFQKAYCTPLVIEQNGQPQLISPGADWVYAYDPATGAEIWKAHYGKLGFSTVPRPVIGDGMVFICTSFIQSRMLAVRYDGTGDVTDTHVVWNSDSQIPKKPSLLFINGTLYFVNDAGIASCFDAQSGKQLWRKRLGGNFSASPLYANGRIYFLSQEGKSTVIEPDANEFRVLAENQLDGRFMASPVVAGKSFILRTDSHLYRIEKK